jgi:twitching motility protein PilT
VSQIDRLLPTLFAHAGSELVLVAGSEPYLRTGDQKTVMVPRKLEASHVRFLLGEILDAGALDNLERLGSYEFIYAPPGSPRVVVNVRAWHEDRAQATLRAYAQPGPSPVVTPGARRSVPMPLEGGGALGGVTVSRAPRATQAATIAAEKGAVSAPPMPGGYTGELTFDGLLRYIASETASDLHLSTSQPPSMRKHGAMQPIRGLQPVTEEELMSLVEKALPARNRAQFLEENDTDFAYEIKGVSRFRVNMFRDRFGPGIVARTIPTEILSAEKLGLPAAVRALSNLAKGLVLVTGPTGSGKSTTLAAIIDLINRERDDHIITLEDPIEFVHPSKRCFINQREIGVHTKDFKRALRAALREDPDIVLVGEMRDLETVAIAIETAETGHLVFGTLHTTTAVSTVDRIIDQFPGERQAQIRTMLSESLKAVIAQTLCKKVGGGRVAALEVLISTPAVANLIREGKTFQIQSVMQTSRKLGMQLLNDALVAHVNANRITAREAYMRSVDKSNLLQAFTANAIPFEVPMQEDPNV